MKKLILVSLFLLGSLGLLFFFVQKQNTNPLSNESAVKLPTLVNAANPESNTSVISPDGKVTLSLKTLTSKSGKTFTVTNNSQPVYTTSLVNGEVTLPLNAWSINDKSFFIKVEEEAVANFIAFPGEINVSDKFKEKYPNYTLQDVTGWADANLLIINASTGEKDVSYWFDTKSQSFIQLSSRFN